MLTIFLILILAVCYYNSSPLAQSKLKPIFKGTAIAIGLLFGVEIFFSLLMIIFVYGVVLQPHPPLPGQTSANPANEKWLREHGYTFQEYQKKLKAEKEAEDQKEWNKIFHPD